MRVHEFSFTKTLQRLRQFSRTDAELNSNALLLPFATVVDEKLESNQHIVRPEFHVAILFPN